MVPERDAPQFSPLDKQTSMTVQNHSLSVSSGNVVEHTPRFSGTSEKERWHMITSEYPPQTGGVSDYTALVAAGLANAGDEVHVWCPQCAPARPAGDQITIHPELGKFSPADLKSVGKQLDSFPAPRHLFVQWVPHGYGYRSMNLAFCAWLWNRAIRHGDRVELMVHEPFLPFGRQSLRQNAAALVHRLMTVILLRAARRVWVSIPGWEPCLRPYAMGRSLMFRWLPIFSNIPVAADHDRTQAIRRQYAEEGQVLIGHFGTFGTSISSMLEGIILALAKDPEGQVVLLAGHGSEQFRDQLIRKQPGLASFVRATGKLPADAISQHLAACDILIQPYPDGVSSRRTSFMAGLAHGKPMVTTLGELTEPLWREQIAVALAAPDDTQGFVEKVRRLIRDPGERLRAGRLASQLYQERFDISRTVAALRGQDR